MNINKQQTSVQERFDNGSLKCFKRAMTGMAHKSLQILKKCDSPTSELWSFWMWNYLWMAKVIGLMRGWIRSTRASCLISVNSNFNFLFQWNEMTTKRLLRLIWFSMCSLYLTIVFLNVACFDIFTSATPNNYGASIQIKLSCIFSSLKSQIIKLSWVAQDQLWQQVAFYTCYFVLQ